MKLLEMMLSTFLIVLGLQSQAGITYGLTWGLFSIVVGSFGFGWYLCKSIAHADATSVKQNLERIIDDDYPAHTFWRGSEAQFKLKKWTDNTKGDDIESIAMVAIRHPNGYVYASPPLARHPDLFGIMEKYGDGKDPKDNTFTPYSNQGFITSRGRYVGRYEAMSVAKRANQLIRISGTDDALYSEDLFNGSLYNKYIGNKVAA